MVLALALTLALPLAVAAPGGQDGRYEGEGVGTGGGANAVTIKFRVADDGRKIKDWRVLMFVICINPILPVQYTKQPMPTMKVDDDGRFRKVHRFDEDGVRARIEVSGRLVGKRVKGGRLRYRVGACERADEGEPVRWKAKRVTRNR
ncbi:MAG: hypothetical protein GEU88_06620 [Solirubrobacterales bacterium]|nr:hypothetical protein [Solirubrobacterales bacterium]